MGYIYLYCKYILLEKKYAWWIIRKWTHSYNLTYIKKENNQDARGILLYPPESYLSSFSRNNHCPDVLLCRLIAPGFELFKKWNDALYICKKPLLLSVICVWFIRTVACSSSLFVSIVGWYPIVGMYQPSVNLLCSFHF